ncbi:MAG: membrane protein insertion efficiency factor YidD [Actinomycetota bacterium]
MLRCLSWYREYRSLQPSACRYLPTCSSYAAEAIEVHGVLRGSGLALRRIGRCHPLGGHGLDPVPAPKAPRSPKGLRNHHA